MNYTLAPSEKERMHQQLAGKTALVTGSTQGIGLAIARLFAERGAEAVMTCGRREKVGEQVAAQIAHDTGARVEFFAADIGKVAGCSRLVTATVSALKRIDVLVNVAGKTDRGTILDTSEELFDQMIAVNLKGPFFLMQEVIKVMRKHGRGGSIVNIGSIAAYAGQPFLSPYVAAKGGLAALSKNTAFAVMCDRIRVNCLNIGWTSSDGEDAIQRKYHGAQDGWLEEAAKKMPFGRLLEPQEVARAVAFLASEESGMMTGEAFIFDQVIPAAFLSQPVPERLPD